ncbi:MAG: amidohydrolase family protein [Planctomycetaceae bacterium]|nr:amidohydrolase family protein [Planctomycetaceae bacterium]
MFNMPDLQIFDSLTHPTPEGKWLDSRYDHLCSAEALRRQMDEADIRQLLAVGMGESVGGYREARYADWVRTSIPGALPVAYCDPSVFPSSGPELRARCRSLRDAGYVGIKLHPRLGGFTFENESLADLIQTADETGLFSMICTYNYGKGLDLDRLSLGRLTKLLNSLDDPRVILLHGGTVAALEWAEAVRMWPNVLLDLSFTILRFKGSSLDADLRFLFRTFDERICVGSDHPQFSLVELRRRVQEFAQATTPDKLAKIAYRNLDRFVTESSR